MADQEDNKMPPPDDIPDVVKAYNNDVFLQSKTRALSGFCQNT